MMCVCRILIKITYLLTYLVAYRTVTAVEVGFRKPKFFRFKKTFKNLKKSEFRKTPKPHVIRPNFIFYRFFSSCVNNLIQMIFKYELRFVAFTGPNLCLFVVILRPAFVS